MFAKLESMREVITEVNSQFKDPVCAPPATGDRWPPADITPETLFFSRKRPHSCVCVYPSSCPSTRPSV